MPKSPETAVADAVKKLARVKRQHGAATAALAQFDKLPDLAVVRVGTVAALRGTSTATVWRHVKLGLLPPSISIGPNSTGWRVGELRKTLGAAK